MTEPPLDALPDGEPVAFVKKFKTSLIKKWSYTKADSIWSMGDLACFLWALDRREEALSISCHVASQIPCPPPLKGGRFNFNIWSPASRLHSLVAHLGSPKEPVELARAALLDQCSFARDNPPYLAEQVEEAARLSSTASGAESQKWECVSLARSINCMTLFSVLATAGDSLFTPHGREAGILITQLLPKLATRLRDKK